jgi:hypothetical protein
VYLIHFGVELQLIWNERDHYITASAAEVQIQLYLLNLLTAAAGRKAGIYCYSSANGTSRATRDSNATPNPASFLAATVQAQA